MSLSKQSSIAIASHLIALHFYLAGDPITQHPEVSSLQSQDEQWKAEISQEGYLLYLQETAATAPWLYSEDPDKKRDDSGKSTPVLAWLFFSSRILGEAGGEAGADVTSGGQESVDKIVEDGIATLLEKLSSEANCRRGPSVPYSFNVNFPLSQSASARPGAVSILDITLSALQKQAATGSSPDQFAINTYRVLHQHIKSTSVGKAELDSSTSVRVVFPRIQYPKLPNTENLPKELQHVDPSLFSRGEVVLGIYVSSVFAGYVSLLGLSAKPSSQFASLAAVSQELEQVQPEQSGLYISLLYINKQFRRMGLGRKLMEFVLDPRNVREVAELAERAASGGKGENESVGASKGLEDREVDVERAVGVDVWVTVDAENAAAGALYESVGFVEIGRNWSVGGKYPF